MSAMCLDRTTRVCVPAFFVFAFSLLLPGAVSHAQITSNANVNPCINTGVINGSGNNVCISNASGSLTLADLSVGVNQTGGVNVGPGVGNLLVEGGASLFVTSPIYVAVTQAGVLLVRGGATVSSGQGLVVGQNPGIGLGPSGDVEISGGNFVTPGSIIVGDAGTGEVEVSSGGNITLSGPGSQFVIASKPTSIIYNSVSVSDGEINLSGANAFLTVGGAGGGALTVSSGGQVTLTGASAGIGIGQTGGGGGVTINPGGTITLAGNLATFGTANSLGSTGDITVNGGQLNMPGQNSYLAIGNAGNGNNSIIQNGGQVTVASLEIGAQPTGQGILVVNTKGTLAISNSLVVGQQGVGSLELESGGAVTLTGAMGLVVGSQTGSNGAVTINPGGTITLTADLANVGVGNSQGSQGNVNVNGGQLNLTGQNSFIGLGNGGTGTLTIQNGGQVSVGGMSLGNLATGVGTVVVGNGSGQSVLTVANKLTVGDAGTGKLQNGGVIAAGNLTIKDGGQVIVADMTIANQPAASGIVTVGNGSGRAELTVTNTLTVGNQGNISTLDIRPGGTVTLTSDNAHLTAGLAQNSVGGIVVDGGQLILPGHNSLITVGDAGTGNMLFYGGQASVAGMTVGNQATGVGTVVVGETSLQTGLTVANNLTVGNQSTHTSSLTINASGTVTQSSDNAGLDIGFAQGSNGAVTVNGGKLNLPGQNSSITVGDGGTGTLTIQNSGQVSVVGMTVGNQVSGVGTVVVGSGSGQPSVLTVANNLTVGNQNTNTSTMTINAGGMVTQTNASLDIGLAQGGKGAVTVNGGQLTLLGQTSFIAVGDAGTGTLTIQNGGQVRVTGMIVGSQATGVGTINVQQGSTLMVNQTLIVGSAAGGTGTLHINNAGQVNVSAALAAPGFAPQQLNITSGGTLIVNQNGSLYVDGPGYSINDAGGTVQLLGGSGRNTQGASLVQSLVSPRTMPSTSLSSPALTGQTTLSGIVEVKYGSPAALLPGSFIPLIDAHSIDLGSGLNGPQLKSLGVVGPNLFVNFGSAQFQTQVVGNQFLTPERLSIDCGSGACDQVVGVRTVNAAMTGGSPLPSIPTLQSIPQAQSFVQGSTVASLAQMAAAVYQTGGAYPPGYTLISSINLDGLAADAVASQFSKTIVIAIRGTEPYVAANWAANFGFSGVPTTTLNQYVNNLAAFAGSIYAANPGSSVVFAGHSLGGALAEIVGFDTGAQAYAFNAPPVGLVLGSFSAQTSYAPNFGSAQPFVNVRLDGDRLVSGLPLPNPVGFGQTVTLEGDPLLYAINHPLLESLSLQNVLPAILKEVLPAAWEVEQHEIATLRSYLLSDSPVVSIQQGNSDPSVSNAANQILAPQSKPLPTLLSGALPALLEYGSNVEAGNIYIIDPDLESGYAFISETAGQDFAGVILPEIVSTQETFEIDSFVNGMWIFDDAALAGSYFDFGSGGVSEFRILGLTQGITDPSSVPELFFGINFENSGAMDIQLEALDSNGNPLGAPEPGTMTLFSLALFIVVATNQRRRRAANCYRN